MSDKKLFQDKRWNQNPKGEVIGYAKVTDQEKKCAEELLKEIIKKEGDNNGMRKEKRKIKYSIKGEI